MPRGVYIRKEREHKYIYRACKLCNINYKVYPSGLERSKYCSRVCKDKDLIGKVPRLKSGLGRGRPKGTKKVILKQCLVCGKYHNNRKYCSNTCFDTVRKTAYTGWNKGKIPWNKGKVGLQKHTEECKDRMREKRLLYMSTHPNKFKDTDIEIIMKEALIDAGFEFSKQVPIYKYCVDFLINKTVIECDGHYWHNRPGDKAKDFKRDMELISRGYTVFRFSGFNIKNNIHECIKTIIF